MTLFKFQALAILISLLFSISCSDSEQHNEQGDNQTLSDGDKESTICENGFRENENGACVDINECEEDETLCSFDKARCVNLEGSYKCLCEKGFVVEKGERCISRFDFEGPVFKGNVLLISNESTEMAKREFTGTFDAKKIFPFTRNKMPSRTDVNALSTAEHMMPLDIPQMFAFSKKKPLPFIGEPQGEIPMEGDRKRFYVEGENIDEDGKLELTLQKSGKFCNIWAEDPEMIDKELAEDLSSEFDDVIYGKISENFSAPSDVDGNGKIDIFLFDTFLPGGGYYNQNNLFDAEGSNRMDIIHVDHVKSDYKGIITHEFEHLCHAGHEFLVEKNGHYEHWIGEGLSTSAEGVYGGFAKHYRDYFNYSTSIRNGQSLIFFDWGNDSTANYTLSYLFFQYVRLQAGQGPQIYKEVIEDENNDYKAIENVVKKYVDPEMTFGEFMTSFRLALLLNEEEGLYGFNSEDGFETLKPGFYEGKGFEMRSAGAVYVKIDGEFEAPEDKGDNIKYVGIYTGETTED